MSLKIFADTSVVSNQYISSVKLLHPEQEITNDSQVKITTIISQTENDLTNGTIYNQMVDWMTQKKNPKLIDSFINSHTMIYRVDELIYPLDNPYQVVIENNEMRITYQGINPPGKLTLIPPPSSLIKGMVLTLHYGDSTFFANIQSDDNNTSRQMIVTPPNGMSCQQFTGQDNCFFSDSNKPKKLKILGPSPKPPSPNPPTPKPPSPKPPSPKPPSPKPPSPKPPTKINVDPYIYSINDLNTQIDFQGYPKEGKYFYIIDFDGKSVDILVATKDKLQNSLPILQQIDVYKKMIEAGQKHNSPTIIEQNTQLLQDYISEESLFPVSVPVKPDKNGNISLAKNPKGFVKNVKSDDVLGYTNGNLIVTDPNFKQTLQLKKSGNDFIIQDQQPPSPDSDKKKDTSSGMSKNELYAIIFGSIGGVLLIGLILYFDLRSRKKAKKKQKKH